MNSKEKDLFNLLKTFLNICLINNIHYNRCKIPSQSNNEYLMEFQIISISSYRKPSHYLRLALFNSCRATHMIHITEDTKFSDVNMEPFFIFDFDKLLIEKLNLFIIENL